MKVLSQFLLLHVRVENAGRGIEGLLDSAEGGPPGEVEVGASLVIGARGAGATKRLLAHNRSSGLVINVEVASGMGELEG